MTFVRWVLGTCCVALAGIAACGDDPNSAPTSDAGPADASVPPAEDAAPTADAADAADAAPPFITVKVLESGVPQALRRVVFHDATGSVIGDFTTDPGGLVVSTTLVPSMVTVFQVGEGAETRQTFLDVEKGDVLIIDSPPTLPPMAPHGSYSLGFAGITGPGTMTATTGHCDLGSPATVAPGAMPTTLFAPLDDTCISDTLLFSFMDDSGFSSLRYAWLKGLTPPAVGATKALSLPALSPAIPVTVTGLATPGVFDAGPGFSASSTIAAQEKGFDYYGYPINGVFESGKPLTFYLPGPGFTDSYTASSYVSDSKGIIAATRTFAPPSAATTFDLAAVALSSGAKTVTTSATASPTIMWTADGSVADVDAVNVAFRWEEKQDDPVTHFWSFFMASNRTSLDLPSLPAGVSSPKDRVYDTSVAFVDYAPLTSYTEVKKLPWVRGGALLYPTPTLTKPNRYRVF